MSRRIMVVLAALSVGVGPSSQGRAEEAVPSLDRATDVSMTGEPSASVLNAVDAVEPMRLSMEFQDANLKDVLKIFSQQSGINIIATADIGDQPVTLYLEQVTVLDALDQILRAGNLTYDRAPGSDIYLVKPKEADEVALTETRVYRLRYGRVSKSNLAKAAAAFGASTPFEAVLEGEEGTSQSGAGGDTEDVGIDVVLRSLLTDRGSMTVDGRTNSLVITDIPANFPRLEGALAALDVRTPQIMIDAELIETSLNKLKDLGVEWGTGSEGTVFQLTPAKRTTRMPFSTLWGHEGAEPIATGTPGLTLGSLDTSQAIAALQMLQNDTESKILARPKVLTLDNESAIIRLTTEQAVGFQSTSQTGTGSVTAEPERMTTGIVMVVTPQVNEDGFITMLVEPSVTKTVAAQITAPSGQSTPVDPKTRSSRTLVRIRSGDTLVVGGLIDRSEKESLRRVPILADIPFVGEAFKNEEIDDAASELIVFVTPRILEEGEAPQVAAAGQGPLGPREQEPSGARQESIEETLNELEQSRL